MSHLRLALVQMAAPKGPAEGRAAACVRIAEAAGQGAQLVCLQELFATPYFCQSEEAERFDLAEPAGGPTSQAIAAAARQHGVTVLSSYFEKRAPGLYHNTAELFGPTGELVGRYRKMHIPDDPQYYEKFYFAPGDLGFRALEAPLPGRAVQVGPLVCWDQWFPEAARACALAGAELLLYPTAIGWLPEDKAELGEAQRDAWLTVQRSHAIANGVFVAAANRVGIEREGDQQIEFWGHSFVCDPQGRILAQAGQEECVLVADCDLSLIETTRRGWPFLRDRRIDAYAGLLQRFGS